MEKKSGYWKAVFKKSWENINKVKQFPKLVVDLIPSLLGAYAIQRYLNVSQATALITIGTGFSIWILFFLIGFVINVLFFVPYKLYSELKLELEKYEKKNLLPIRIIKTNWVDRRDGQKVYQIELINISKSKKILSSCSIHVIRLFEVKNGNLIEVTTNSQTIPWPHEESETSKYICRNLHYGIPTALNLFRTTRFNWIMLVGVNGNDTLIDKNAKYKLIISLCCNEYDPNIIEIDFDSSDAKLQINKQAKLSLLDEYALEKFGLLINFLNGNTLFSIGHRLYRKIKFFVTYKLFWNRKKNRFKNHFAGLPFDLLYSSKSKDLQLFLEKLDRGNLTTLMSQEGSYPMMKILEPRNSEDVAAKLQILKNEIVKAMAEIEIAEAKKAITKKGITKKAIRKNGIAKKGITKKATRKNGIRKKAIRKIKKRISKKYSKDK